MVNDDLTGVVVAIDTMRHLAQRERRRYTYRLILVPETIGSIAYLSHNEDLIGRMKGGLFFEMLALDLPHTLQLSFEAKTEVDRCFLAAFRQHEPNGTVLPLHASNVLNDERQFNAPGVRVPMLSLLRIQPRDHPEWPYREYHSSSDNLELASQQRLEETRSLVLSMIDTLERNVVPVNQYSGEVFLSRFGLNPDWSLDPRASELLLDVMYRIDGTRSILDMAEDLNAPFESVARVVDLFRGAGLVS
jgi:aminopeptidase-like protein